MRRQIRIQWFGSVRTPFLWYSVRQDFGSINDYLCFYQKSPYAHAILRNPSVNRANFPTKTSNIRFPTGNFNAASDTYPRFNCVLSQVRVFPRFPSLESWQALSLTMVTLGIH